jgi:methylenetetrahydrofolate dehydrogenase (NADP+)/methenyltetrahydrofolate cyclohydrolase
MNTRLLDGRSLASEIREETTRRAQALSAQGTPPSLSVISATEDEGSQWYVRSIERAATKLGIDCAVIALGPNASVGALNDALDEAALSTHATILQAPLPPGIDGPTLASRIPVERDVDGANPLSLGRLEAGLPAFAPSTAAAVIALLDNHRISISGRHVVVVGRSLVVGKPLTQLLLGRDATVTVCHSRTVDLARHTRRADILVVAIGRPGLVRAEHVGPNAVVIDVGTNTASDGSLIGDVSAEDVLASSPSTRITPVPGGVGPVTTALLLRHVVEAAEALGSRFGGDGRKL